MAVIQYVKKYLRETIMHIQKNVATYNVTLDTNEIQMIVFGLCLHSINPKTKPEHTLLCTKLAETFKNASKQ